MVTIAAIAAAAADAAAAFWRGQNLAIAASPDAGLLLLPSVWV
jgi:hypothetical protein